MAEEIFMDVPAVRDISNQFGEFAEILNNANTVLEGLIYAAHAGAFVSFGTSEIYAQYLETIQPYVEQYAEFCAEIKKDLSLSIKAYEEGDATGATRFH